MEQYIKKSDLVARIKKLKMDIGNIFNDYDEGFWEGRSTAFDNVICALDTLEVKGVDLEKIINDYFKDWKFDDELDIMIKPNNYSASFTDLKDIAKHFFELGLKAQKGEKV